MNAVEIEEAVTQLVEQPFDAAEFPFAFLEAFGNKQTTIKRLRDGNTNRSDVGGVLQYNHIHIGIAEAGKVGQRLSELRNSKATKRSRAKFVLATDGEMIEAEETSSGNLVACAYEDLPNHFGFFLPLAGITVVEQIRESSIDIRATSRLNKLYLELLRVNPDWGTEERQLDMNHFMARLIFSFFAEDTDIIPDGLFTRTIEQMSEPNSSNTHEVLSAIFTSMSVHPNDREGRIPAWVREFPYVNGGLFSGSTEAPIFSREARAYLIHVGKLNWQEINPDIFGSMIQAISDEDERSSLGMHYTSVPNILKVLNPLFLDDLEDQLEAAGDNPRKLLNLRNRMKRIRVFDPACGSGNFLVIAYKEMRRIEAEINRRRGEEARPTEIPLTNFRGIEINSFPAEIARLALIIAEYQANVQYRGRTLALAEFLPLKKENWITWGNALRLDWLKLVPPTGTATEQVSEGLFPETNEHVDIDFENEGGETFICGNPPYLGRTKLSDIHKQDLNTVFGNRINNWKMLDYSTAWIMKAADYCTHTKSVAAFVTTNSVTQGQNASILWPLVFRAPSEIQFAHTSFKWSNLASYNAGVTVVIVGITSTPTQNRYIYSEDNGKVSQRVVKNINAYLAPAPNVTIEAKNAPDEQLPRMSFGNMPRDGGNLLLNHREFVSSGLGRSESSKYVRRYYGAAEFIRGALRYCLWIPDRDSKKAVAVPEINKRLTEVVKFRKASKASSTVRFAATPHRFVQIAQNGTESAIIIPRVSSESREYLPVGYLPPGSIVSDSAFALFDAPLWNMALIASRLHLVWIATVCGKLETRYRYSNTLGWNTFPVPTLTTKNKEDLTHAAEEILLAREAHFPATIADLYEPDKMPDNLRRAHELNDEIVERIFIGRRFRNDSERLEKLFELYEKRIGKEASA